MAYLVWSEHRAFEGGPPIDGKSRACHLQSTRARACACVCRPYSTALTTLEGILAFELRDADAHLHPSVYTLEQCQFGGEYFAQEKGHVAAA